MIIFRFIKKKSKKSSYPSRFQGVQATQLYNFYGVYADSDKLKVYNESINTQLRLSLSKSEFDYYNDLIKSANNNDEFQIEFYTDKDGNNRTSFEVMTSNVQFLGSKKMSDESSVEQAETDPYEDFGNKIEIDDNFLD